MRNYTNECNNETYKKFINKISQVTKTNNNANTNLHDYQNRRTIGDNDDYYNSNNQNINKISYNLRNNQPKEIPQNYMHIYAKMNQKLINMRNNPDTSINYNLNNQINNNGKNIFNGNNNNDDDIPLGGGKDAPIVKILNQYNNQNEAQRQNNNNNINTKIIYNNNNNDNNNNKIFLEISESHYVQKNENHIRNGNNIPEDQSQNPKDVKESSKLAKSLLYGLIFGSLGTLLLWCRDPRVREYIKACYHNINSESILNFFKKFLHPMDLIKSCSNNIALFKEVLKESLKYIYHFIDDYSDLWRLLGVVVMVYILWVIIKKIFRKIQKNKKNKINVKKEESYQIIY
jgi:hypothetical protein